MKTDLEYLVEQYGIELFKAHDLLKGKSLVHFEEDRPAERERIVFKAEIGEHRLDIPGGGAFNVVLKITYYAPTGDKARNNMVRKAMVEAMWESTSTRPTLPCIDQFQYLLLEDEVSSDRTLSDNARERSVTYNLIAQPKVTAAA